MEKYEFLSRTGEGAYGSVWRARDKNTGVLVAVKKLKDVPATEEEGEIAMREVRVLQLAKHVNIVNLLAAYKSQSGRLYLVFEYVERTLLQELKANRGGLQPAAVKSITWQLLQALGYLHRKQIIHRDVKPSNILLTDGGVVKICDFGFARPCENGAANPAYTTYVVTRWYRPPEVLVGDTYGPPVDIWALGCIFAEMLVGKPLFPGKNHHDQLWLILKCLGAMTERQLDLLDADPQFACFRLPAPSEIETLEQRIGGGVSPAAMQVLRACLDPDPKQRASAEELLAMPYFHGVTDALPISELLSYPDPEMRSKLERALTQDQVNTAAAAAREAMLLMHGVGRRVSAPTPNKQQQQQQAPLAADSSGSTSPNRPAQQPSQPPSSEQQSLAGPPLPVKAATAAKLDPCPCPESQRPPLQRYITAPPGSMASRAMGQQLQPQLQQPSQQPQQQQLQPLAEQCDGGSMTGPTASVPVPVRGRGSWRLSNDGSGDCSGDGISATPALNPAVRQFGCIGRQTPQATAAPAGAVGVVAGGGGGLDASRAVPDQLLLPLQRPPYQRTTWNGAAALPLRCNGGASGSSCSNGGAVSNGGAGSNSNAVSNGGAAHYGPQGSFPGAYFNNSQATTYDAFPLHRKAHSLAGNEWLPPASNTPVGIRNVAGLGAPQGRSLGPPLGIGTTTSGISSTNSTNSNSSATTAFSAFHLPPSSAGIFLPATGTGPRMAASTMALASGALRGAHSTPLGPIHACSTRRVSNNGCGGGGGAGPAAAACIPSCSSAPLARTPLQVTCIAQASENLEGLTFETEFSEDSPAADAAAAGHTEGRRASDTVLYAALSLKDAKGRLEKAPQVNWGLSRLYYCSQNDGASTGGNSSGSGNSSGGGAPGLGVLRNPSFGRGGGLVPTGTGPSSPDGAISSNLPPLQATPQRRTSAPETMALAVLHGGGGAVASTAAGGATSRPGPPHASLHSTLSTPSGVNHTQRHRHPCGQHHGHAGGAGHQGSLSSGHPHGPSQVHQTQTQGTPVLCGVGVSSLHRAAATGDGANGPDFLHTGNGHGLLPSLDVGYPGKAARASSAGNGTSAGLTARRPSRGAQLRAFGPDAHCKREDMSKILLLEAVPEASVL